MSTLARFGYAAIFLLVVDVSMSTALTNSKTILVGSSLEISCSSSFVSPTWSWVGTKLNQPKTLAFGGTKPHPNLKDPRFSFTQSDSNYFLKITNVKVSDAGTYNCQGDSYHQTTLNVLR